MYKTIQVAPNLASMSGTNLLLESLASSNSWIRFLIIGMMDKTMWNFHGTWEQNITYKPQTHSHFIFWSCLSNNGGLRGLVVPTCPW